jgi:hypothetical protein
VELLGKESFEQKVTKVTKGELNRSIPTGIMGRHGVTPDL